MKEIRFCDNLEKNKALDLCSTFGLVVELKTERLILKKLSMKDIDDYIEWKSQEIYHKYLPSKVKTKDEYKNVLEKIVKGYDDKQNPSLIWGVFFNNKLIGTVSIEDWNKTHKWCEIGWGLNPKFQKQGFAYESIRCLIKYIFEELQMNRISIVIWDGNESSKNLAKKLGFVQEGIERKARYKNNKFIDLYCYGLLKEEWKN